MIKTEELTKVYQMGRVEVKALLDVTLQLENGEFVALMGPSGSGKSTLLHLLGCLETPTSGRYFLDGRDVSSLSDDERSTIRGKCIGFIFQNFNLLPRLTAIENVLLPLVYRGSTNGAEKDAKDVLKRVGLSGRLSHTPTELSGGEKQRVAIARALINNPVLILADEPTGNLDSANGEEILRLLSSLHAESRTILMVTHSEEAAAYAERVVYMRDGRIVYGSTNR
ncbi:MAG: ATP-binding cassette domain-containing protein [Anaerolineales bacterium]|nr:ATP-binding cassette domain-containing protein [Anaerolineales bacterium]